MALPLPTVGGSGSLQLRVLGFPVSIHASFYLLTTLLAFAGGLKTAEVVVWLVVVGVSILVHELGHAVVARRAGAEPTIELYAMGGLTRWVPAGEPTRRTTLAVSLAGPFLGVALGLVFVAIGLAVRPLEDGSLLAFALGAAVYINVGWGVLNLLPILPLDGGHVLMSLLPGDAARRATLAAVVSVVTGALAAVVALRLGLQFGGLLAVYFAVTNATGLVAGRSKARDLMLLEELQAAEADLANGEADDALRVAQDVRGRARDPQLRQAARTIAVVALVLADRPREAMSLALEESPDGQPTRVDPSLEGLLLVATGQDALGLDRLRTAFATQPAVWTVRPLAVVLARRGHDVDATLTELCGGEVPELVSRLAHDSLAAYPSQLPPPTPPNR